jgi:hypothetical protein
MLVESIVIIVGWIVMPVGGCDVYWTVHVPTHHGARSITWACIVGSHCT